MAGGSEGKPEEAEDWAADSPAQEAPRAPESDEREGVASADGQSASASLAPLEPGPEGTDAMNGEATGESGAGASTASPEDLPEESPAGFVSGEAPSDGALPDESWEPGVDQDADRLRLRAERREDLNKAQEPVLEAVGGLQKTLDGFLKETEWCSREMVKQLHQEMQEYKRDFLKEAMRPVLLDVILLYDSIAMTLDAARAADEDGDRSTVANLEVLLTETEEILARQGVERMASTPDVFDATVQQAIEREMTGDRDADFKVARRLKGGFALQGRPLRKEVVTVLRYQAPPKPTPEASESADGTAPMECTEGEGRREGPEASVDTPEGEVR